MARVASCGMTKPDMLPIAEWDEQVDDIHTGDPLWTVQAYRMSVYAIACHTFDRVHSPAVTKAPAFDQMTRALGSIAANIAEGYSRSSIADRIRFYGYALGSTRESIAWYDTLTAELGETVVHRQQILVQIRRLLLTTVRNARPDTSTRSMSDIRRRAADEQP
jgi:four helix bundle protein